MVVIFIVNTTLVHHRLGQGWGGRGGQIYCVRRSSWALWQLQLVHKTRTSEGMREMQCKKGSTYDVTTVYLAWDPNNSWGEEERGWLR